MSHTMEDLVKFIIRLLLSLIIILVESVFINLDTRVGLILIVSSFIPFIAYIVKMITKKIK